MGAFLSLFPAAQKEIKPMHFWERFSDVTNSNPNCNPNPNSNRNRNPIQNALVYISFYIAQKKSENRVCSGTRFIDE